jgi:hypothetical protein
MIFQQLSQQLKALDNLLLLLNDDQYTQRIEHLGNASIGGHTRHIIELIQCAISGYDKGAVDYVNRSRDLALQNDRSFALSVLEDIVKKIKVKDKQLTLLVEEIEEAIESTVTTTYFREIVYNTEHTIHHLALIKVALFEMNLDIVDDDFGMAYSTIKFKSSLSISN